MSDTLAPLILDFLQWIGAEPRPYAEVMDTWRTSCPRLTIWEDALDRGFVTRARSRVELTPLGRRFLEASGREPSPARD
ncbi:MAG TPA: hypothetical protein VIK30_06550 [Polyangia bacterium]